MWPEEIVGFQWEEGTQRVGQLQAKGESPLVILGESVIEKPENIQVEGFCPV
jgi:hypothetical protein